MSRLLARLQRHHHEVEHRRRVHRALTETQHLEPNHTHHEATLGGDAHRLRGIPALARGGLGGAIIGTRPDRDARP